MSDNQSSRHADNEGQGLNAARVAGLIYGGASVAAALVFWAVTTFTGSYPAVGRYGGAAWVFILVMIVLMPIVIPRVRKWRRNGQVSAIQSGPGERSSET